jgi:outer membrane protein assembly factor BamB
MNLKQLRFAALIAGALAMSSCGVFRGGPPTTPVVGERIAVLATETDVAIDPATAAMPMALPAPAANSEWGQSGGNASKSMGHVDLGPSPTRIWLASAGAGTTLRARLASAPVVAQGQVYTIDTTATVRAFDANSGAPIWQTRFGVEPGNEPALFGGGVAHGQGRIFATNGLGFVAAFDATTGSLIWQVRPGGPLRGAPTVVADTLYVLSQDNQIYSLRPEDGATNWSQAAALEIAGVFGSSAPAFAQGTVVAGFSSGELVAYRFENGRVVWQDALARTTIRTSVSALSDINADPVIDSGQVIAIGQGGRMVALELITGQRMWELNLAGIATPWVAGDWVFVVTDDGKLLAIARATGRVRWMTQLPQFRRERAQAGPISYEGPILAGGRLILASNQGALIFVDPVTGGVQGQVDVGAGVSLPPVVANNTLYLLDDNARLHAFR